MSIIKYIYFTLILKCDILLRYIHIGGDKMGILADAFSISVGVFIGSCCRKKIKFKINQYFAIAVMIISLLGLIENVFMVSHDRILGSDIVVVVISLIVGSALGDWLRLDERIHNCEKGEKLGKNGFLEAAFLFGIGGLQIAGPILMAVNGDNTQLYLKAIVDFPFALLLGAAYGKTPMLSCIPVAAIQGLVALAAYFGGSFISQSMLMSLCAMGFIILFFTGFNMISNAENKIKNTNMVPGVLFVIVFNVVKGWIV